MHFKQIVSKKQIELYITSNNFDWFPSKNNNIQRARNQQVEEWYNLL